MKICKHENWHKEIIEYDPIDDCHDSYEEEVAVCEECGKYGMLEDDDDEDSHNEKVDWDVYDDWI